MEYKGSCFTSDPPLHCHVSSPRQMRWELGVLTVPAGFGVKNSSTASLLAAQQGLWSLCPFLTMVFTPLPGFPFSDNVNAYCLHIAEDDGEVDTDFPPLDSNEPIHKFGFSTLALVEKYSSPGLTSKESLFVRM